MSYLTKIEAAIKLGYGVELVDYFIKTCPKKDEGRTLQVLRTDGGELIDEKELLAFQHYLSQPWPLSKKGARSHIPEAIAEDVKRESHCACAICGYMDNGELAHIRSFAATLNNSPDNLILLCPNHHTKYDLGYKPSSNLTSADVEAAKTLKRNSRVRIMRYEANAIKCLKAVIEFVARLNSYLRKQLTDNERDIYLTELGSVLRFLPEFTRNAEEAASEDRDLDDVDKRLARIAPHLSRASAGAGAVESEFSLRQRADEVVRKSRAVLPLIDEARCPHCSGSGQTGLGGSLCAYCGGSCFVSRSRVKAYEPDELGEVDCPRCDGSGQTGLVGDLCVYCSGDGYVTEQQRDEYDEGVADEVECPHCSGSGQTGLGGSLCTYCGGSCSVSRSRAKAYEPDEMDEVDCPRCDGSGQMGLVGDFCSLCKGDCVVSRDIHDAYLEEHGRE